MKGFKNPSFQDRANASAIAKANALEKMKTAPKLSEEEIAERAKRAAEREAKEAAKREAARLAREEKARAEAEAREAAKPVVLTEEERKAARDAKYAARKARKGRK